MHKPSNATHLLFTLLRTALIPSTIATWVCHRQSAAVHLFCQDDGSDSGSYMRLWVLGSGRTVGSALREQQSGERARPQCRAARRLFQNLPQRVIPHSSCTFHGRYNKINALMEILLRAKIECTRSESCAALHAAVLTYATPRASGCWFHAGAHVVDCEADWSGKRILNPVVVFLARPLCIIVGARQLGSRAS